VDGSTQSGQGASGTLNWNLSLQQITGVDYELIVQPLTAWSGPPCDYNYTINFEIP
jgi:hypothetical protein